MSPGMSLHSVDALLVLGTEDGARLFAKYYAPPHHAAGATPTPPPYPDLKAQKAFEKGLLEKTAKQTGDIILYDNRIVLYKAEVDVMLYVVGSPAQNEIMLYNVVLALRDSLTLLLRGAIDKRSIVENYDLVALAADEIVDDGVVLETDPTLVISRVSKAPAQDAPQLRGLDLSEQSVNTVVQLGKAKLTDWLMQGL
jgi:hypothetical protein